MWRLVIISVILGSSNCLGDQNLQADSEFVFGGGTPFSTRPAAGLVANGAGWALSGFELKATKVNGLESTQISGTVVSPNTGLLLAGVKVLVGVDSEEPRLVATTDSEGYFHFLMEEGGHQIRAEFLYLTMDRSPSGGRVVITERGIELLPPTSERLLRRYGLEKLATTARSSGESGKSRAQQGRPLNASAVR